MLRRQAGTLRQLLKRKLSRLDPFCDRHHRIDAILEKAERRYQRRLAIEQTL